MNKMMMMMMIMIMIMMMMMIARTVYNSSLFQQKVILLTTKHIKNPEKKS